MTSRPERSGLLLTCAHSREYDVKKILLALLLALGLALTGCASTDTPATVTEKADGSKAASKSNNVVKETDSEEETAEETAQLGDTVSVANWDVKVITVELNGDPLIAKANMFNEKPKGRFVLVTYEATYTGAERMGDAWMDLSWSFTDTASKVHDEASAVTPADNQEWATEARKGGTIKQQIVFDIKPDAIKGGILTVEGYDDAFDTVYADFIV